MIPAGFITLYDDPGRNLDRWTPGCQPAVEVKATAGFNRISWFNISADVCPAMFKGHVGRNLSISIPR